MVAARVRARTTRSKKITVKGIGTETTPRDEILCIDAVSGLKRLPDESIDCVVTSPPYWSMRDYGIPETKWSDGSNCVLGLEPELTVYVEHLCEVFDEVYRVLKPTGTLWVNLGDAYAGSWGNYCPGGIKGLQRSPEETGRRRQCSSAADPSLRLPSSFRQSVQKKSLCLIPERFALAMLKRGWILRNRIVWHKPNAMPSSAKDRFANSWEYLFFFVKSTRYSFDLDAVRVPHKAVLSAKSDVKPIALHRQSPSFRGRRLPPRVGEPGASHPNGKNPGDYWAIATRPFRTAHVAVFPEALCETPIKAGCPRNGLVLDPFMGSGTTAIVAQRLGRRYLGFEINPDYVKMARARLAEQSTITQDQQLKGGGEECGTSKKTKT